MSETLFDNVEKQDRERLKGQALRVFDVMADGKWRTLSQIAAVTKWWHEKTDSEAGISARLRCFRKAGHTVERRRVPGGNGLHEYRLTPRKDDT